MTVDLLLSLWRTNRRWRLWAHKETGFKIPTTMDCLLYALCEAAEALDAWLRLKNQNHARNNVRHHTVEQELADVAMLLLTALPEDKVSEWTGPEDHEVDISSIEEMCYIISHIVISCKENINDWYFDALSVLYFIATYPGCNLAIELAKCHNRLAIKHGLTAIIAWREKLLGSNEPAKKYLASMMYPMPWMAEEDALNERH